MPFQISPGVLVIETDLSTIVPNVATTGGGFVGAFRWGPVRSRILLSTEVQLRDTFKEPDDDTYSYYFTAAGFLSYGNNLQVVRVVDEDTAQNATSGGGGFLVLSDEHYDEKTETNALGSYGFIAKYPGDLGNSLAVYIADKNVFSSWWVDKDGDGDLEDLSAFFNTFKKDTASGAPAGTSVFTHERGGANDEMHILIVDKDGMWTGTKGEILESFAFVSKASDAKKSDGRSNYYVDVLNNESQYIWWGSHPSTTGTASQSSELSSSSSSTVAAKSSSSSVVNKSSSSSQKEKTSSSSSEVNKSSSSSNSSSSSGGIDRGTEWGNDAAGSSFDLLTNPIAAVLENGVCDNSKFSPGTLENTSLGADGRGALQTGWDEFADAETVDVSLLPVGPVDTVTAQYVIDNIAEVRKDCVVFISPEQSDLINNITNPTQANTDVLDYESNVTSGLNRSSSYAVLDNNWKLTFDRYNDTNRWVPMNGDIAGLAARTDDTNDPWWSPAGPNRGLIKNIIRLAYNANKAQRDALYKEGINPVISTPGEGTMLFGDKTLLARPSAFDRINVRRLFIVLEKAIAIAAKYSLFEFNDEFTRTQFVNMVEPFLRDVQGRRGLTRFKVVCDTSNNTEFVISRNEFRADIYILPNYSINFIQLNFIATNSSVIFDEIGA